MVVASGISPTAVTAFVEPGARAVRDELADEDVPIVFRDHVGIARPLARLFLAACKTPKGPV